MVQMCDPAIEHDIDATDDSQQQQIPVNITAIKRK